MERETTITGFQPHWTLDHVEREFITYMLSVHKQNRTHAAKALGICTRTLQRKLKKWGLN